MTQTKLEVIGPYTPDHEGPFSFNGEECLVHGTLGTQAFISRPESNKGFIVYTFDLKNAREVPVAREFWVNEYGPYSLSKPYKTRKEAEDDLGFSRGHTIHVREVLPGEGE